MKKRTERGRYVVADPKRGPGKLIFKGTPIKVEPVLRMVARGMDWDEIIRRCDGLITRDAIMEAVRLTCPVPIPKSKTPLKKRIELGQYIVADPEICHGKLTFKGTRIMVEQVLRMVAKGKDWDEITREWRGSIIKEAIAEAVALANEALREKIERRRKRAA